MNGLPMDTLRPISRATMSEQVALQILDMINAGKWKPGQKLPSELELCKALNVGRSTLREALKSLAFVGMVQMRVGEGTYVTEGPSKSVARNLTRGILNHEKDVNDLAEARLALETELAALSAQRATAEDLQNIERIVSEQQKWIELDSDQFVKLDLEFHLSLAASSKNQILEEMLRTIRGALQTYIVRNQQLPPDELTSAHNAAYLEHSKILQALKEHDPKKARAAMAKHLQAFHRLYAVAMKASQPDSSPSAAGTNGAPG